jgi:hypothetical protein
MRRLTESDVVNRAMQSDIFHWKMMNYRCPTCYARICDLITDESVYPHMVGECEKELLLVGPNWVRTGRNVDTPLADDADRREVRMRVHITGTWILLIGTTALAIAGVLGFYLAKGLLRP